MKFLLSLLLLLSFQAFAVDKILLTEKNLVTFRGVVTPDSINKLQLDLVERSGELQPEDIIYLVIDSPGGSVAAGLDLKPLIENLPNKVHTISMFAASMGFYMAQLGEKRYVVPGGIMMGHRAKGGFEGQFETGEVESQLDLWKEIVRSMEQLNADRMGISLEEYKQKVVNELWLFGERAVKENAADKMVQIVCSKELLASRVEAETTKMTLFGPMSTKEVFSGCPLIRNPIPQKKEKEKEEIKIPYRS